MTAALERSADPADVSAYTRFHDVTTATTAAGVRGVGGLTVRAGVTESVRASRAFLQEYLYATT